MYDFIYFAAAETAYRYWHSTAYEVCRWLLIGTEHAELNVLQPAYMPSYHCDNVANWLQWQTASQSIGHALMFLHVYLLTSQQQLQFQQQPHYGLSSTMEWVGDLPLAIYQLNMLRVSHAFAQFACTVCN